MADIRERPIRTSAVEESNGRSWWVYILGIIVLIVIGFFIFRRSNFLSKNTTPSNATPTTTAEISVTVEALVENLVPLQNTIYIQSAAGFTSATYTPETKFLSDTGAELTFSEVKVGSKLKLEGRPNGRLFEAKKITVLSGISKTTTPGVGSSSLTPTPYNLPETGIVEE